jgi:hypothetical protein
MNGLENGRVMASPVHASMMKKRHKFGIDGRLLLVPIIFPCIITIPFVTGFQHQLVLAALAAVLWTLAKVLWELNPYAIEDFFAEVKFPKMLSEGRSNVK